MATRKKVNPKKDQRIFRRISSRVYKYNIPGVMINRGQHL